MIILYYNSVAIRCQLAISNNGRHHSTARFHPYLQDTDIVDSRDDGGTVWLSLATKGCYGNHIEILESIIVLCVY